MAAMKNLYLNALEATSTKDLAELLEERLRANIGVNEIKYSTMVSLMNNLDVHSLNIIAQNSGYMEEQYA